MTVVFATPGWYFIYSRSGFILIPDDNADTPSLVLNSEKISERFGSYYIDVLASDQRIRVSSLYSLHGSQKITRTFCVVHCPALVHPLFAKEHAEIVAGQSIGAVFRRNGWHIAKHTVYFGEIEASADFAPVYDLMDGIAPTALAIHVYVMLVEKAGRRFRYAMLAEVHHPAYLNVEDLKATYCDDVVARQSGHIQKMVDLVKDRMRSAPAG